MEKKRTISILVGSVIILSIIFVILNIQEDRTPPIINTQYSVKTYYHGMKEEELIKGIKAYDERDKNVSDTIIVDSIVIANDKKTAVIIYAAKDNSNNISKVKRRLKYFKENQNVDENYMESNKNPRIKLIQRELTIKKGTTFNGILYVDQAVDDKDEAMKLVRIDGTYDVNQVGTYELLYYIVDSDGNKSNIETFHLTVEN